MGVLLLLGAAYAAFLYTSCRQAEESTLRTCGLICAAMMWPGLWLARTDPHPWLWMPLLMVIVSAIVLLGIVLFRRDDEGGGEEDTAPGAGPTDWAELDRQWRQEEICHPLRVPGFLKEKHSTLDRE